MFPNLFPVAAPVQFLALLPLLYLLIMRGASSREMVDAGIYMAIAFALPQALLLRLDHITAGLLLLTFTITLPLLTYATSKLCKGAVVSSALAFGALLVLIDWLGFAVVPIWGTAQSLGRSWSSYPTLIGFTSVTGITGISFLVGSLQMLFVAFIQHPKDRGRIGIALLTLLLLFGAASGVVWLEKPEGSLKVATLGWKRPRSAEDLSVQTTQGFEELYARPGRLAAGEGARLVVSPELGFYIGQAERQEWLDRFGAVAKSNNLFLAIGYYNERENENRLLFMDPKGEVLSEYVKTHLIPYEPFDRGDGERVVFSIDEIPVGGMICQDDNFTDLSRGYGQDAVPILAIPTADWDSIRFAHFQSTIHRAIESRFAIVRAATDGISAIVSPKGKILASRDQTAKGPGYLVAEVPIYRHRTLFSTLGHWPIPLSLVYLGAMTLVRRRRER
jgi:apolipoprotein N-acyltransferase